MSSSNKPWRAIWLRWLNRRIPPARQVRMSHRTIFIIPARAGMFYGMALLIMLVTAMNYQNSLIYALVFWLFTMGLAAMLFTFRNLSGLTLSAGQAYPCFAGDTIELPVRISAAARRRHESLQLGFPDHPNVLIDVDAANSATAQLSVHADQRGYLSPGRLRLHTQFPIGLYTAWSWVGLDFQVLVYPKPEDVPFIFSPGESGEKINGAVSQQSGQLDFQGLRPYQPGDSLRRIAWKQLARGKGLISKEFDSDEGASCWLDWDALAPAPVEVRLSRLCGWVLKAHQNGWRYGLRLPGCTLSPDHSDAHRDHCLQQLALYGLPDAEGKA